MLLEMPGTPASGEIGIRCGVVKRSMPLRPPTFRPKGQRSRRQVNAEYDARRGSSRKRGYDTEWDKASAAFKQAHPLCLGCQAIGRIEAASVTDHIVPHRGDNALFWDPGNWQPACGWHHDVVKQRLETLFDRGQATKHDLRLDSEKAKAISIDMDARGGV